MRIFLTSIVLILCGCSEPSDERPVRPGLGGALQVVAEPVTVTAVRTRLEAVGTSRARRSVTLYPAAAGEVVDVHFMPGQYVTEGDVLLSLDQRDAQLAVDLAEVRYADAQRLYERYQKSAASGATIPTTLDAAEVALNSSRIDLDRARVALEDRTVTAPFTGYVGITDVELGDRIQTSTAITTLDDREALLVSFFAPELFVGDIQPGDPVSLSTWNSDADTLVGEVVDLGSRIDPATRTFEVRAGVLNSRDTLRPGMSFRVRLDLLGAVKPEVAEIAVQWGADGSYVWTIENGAVRRTPVDVVQRQAGRVLVDGDLHAGDLVVIEGLQRLRPDMKVEAEIVRRGQDARRNTRVGSAEKGPG